MTRRTTNAPRPWHRALDIVDAWTPRRAGLVGGAIGAASVGGLLATSDVVGAVGGALVVVGAWRLAESGRGRVRALGGSGEPAVRPSLLDMVPIRGGAFSMGSADSDEGAYPFERPQHRVMVSDFEISRTPVTRAQYARGLERPVPEDGDRPEAEVSWFDAVEYCNRLSALESMTPCYVVDEQSVEWRRDANGYRLPTEAEWEYACRAGSTTPYHFGPTDRELGDYAWYSENAEGRTHPVGEMKPNAWGLHDMTGNVWEWCWDWFAAYQRGDEADPLGPPQGDKRVLRGGAFDDWALFLRSAGRLRIQPGLRDWYIGFRCVRAAGREL